MSLLRIPQNRATPESFLFRAIFVADSKLACITPTSYPNYVVFYQTNVAGFFDMNAISVILGPHAELHTGIHGALIDTPPAGVTYFLPEHRYRFLFPKGSAIPFDPFRNFAFSETVEFALPANRHVIVHSSRVPVFNRVPWLADMDCLLATLNYGTSFAVGTGGRVQIAPELIRRRQQLMISHYLAGQCAGLLFCTEYARLNFLSFVEKRGLLSPPDFLRLVGKTDVVRPTVPWRGLHEQKEVQPTIVYMSRFRESKGGEVALEVFRRINARYGDKVRLMYVGWLPKEDAVLPPGVTFYPVLDRPAYLKLLARGHIFLSPTEYESYGFGLIEAASYGLAVVTRRGPGMEHIEEIFEDGKNAILVHPQGHQAANIDAYERSVRSLLDSEGRLVAFHDNNRELFSFGALSLQVRDRKLLGYYTRLLEQIGLPNSGDGPTQSANFAREFALESYTLSDRECSRRRALQTNINKRVLIS